MTSYVDSVESFTAEKAEDAIIDDAMDTVDGDDIAINDEDQRGDYSESVGNDESGTNDTEGQDDDDSANTSDFEEEDDTAEESDFEEQDDVDEEDTVEEIELDEDFYGEYSDAEPVEDDEPIDMDQHEEVLIEGDSGEFEDELLDSELSDGELLEEVGTDLDIDDFSDFLDELFTDEPLDQEEEEGILGVDYWSEFGVEEPFEELGFDTDTLYFS